MEKDNAISLEENNYTDKLRPKKCNNKKPQETIKIKQVNTTKSSGAYNKIKEKKDSCSKTNDSEEKNAL